MKNKGIFGVLIFVCVTICAIGLIACNDTTSGENIDGDKTCAHKYTEYVYNNDATCVNDGTETAKCDICGERDTRTKPNTATGVHTFKTYVSNNDAECGVDGTETAQCEYCDEKDARTAENSALEHDWEETVIKKATCTEDGEAEYVCRRCEIKDNKIIDALNHDFKWESDMSVHQSVCQNDGCDETIEPEKHEWAYNNVCIKCEYELPYTRGLSYGLNDTGDGYAVKIPTKITSEQVVIPAYYNGLPVTALQRTNNSLAAFSKVIADIYLPYTVTKIDGSVFYLGSGLKSINIQGEITKLGSFAFTSSGIFENADNWSEDGILYISDILVSAKNAKGAVSVREGVTLIADSAFSNNTNVTEITLPDSVKYIGQSAFSGCSKLEKITVPAEIEFIDSYAFRQCSKLGSVYFKGSIEQWCGMNTLSNPLENNSALYIGNAPVTNLVIPAAVEKIRSSAFAGCSSITSATIQEGVKEIGDGAFSGCKALTTVSVPNSVETLGDSAFANCDKLEKTNTSDAFYIGNSSNRYLILLAIDTRVTSCYISSRTKFIHSSAGSLRSNLTDIYIPSSVKSIGSGAFYQCYEIKSLTIGSGVQTIGDRAFAGACRFPTVSLPDSVKSIGEEAFDSCEMTSLYIGAGLESIGRMAFDDCYKLSYISVSSDNAKYHSTGNCLIETATKTLIRGCKNSVIPDDGSVVKIANEAFENCYGMTRLNIPDSVTQIGTISVCRELQTVTVGHNVTSMNGLGAFCNSIQYNSYDNAYYIGTSDNPYEVLIKAKDTDITSCTVHSDTKLIANSAFYGCRLQTLIIPKGITHIGDAFYSAYVQSVYYGGTLEDWCNITFASYTANPIRSATLYINDVAVEGELVLPDGLTEIKDYTFAGYTKITSITIPDTVKRVGKRAFYDSVLLKTVKLGGNIECFDEEAFYECKNLSSFEFDGTVEEWKNINRRSYWDMSTASYTVTCTDGNIVDE